MATKITITPELDEEKLRQQLDKVKNQKEKIKVDIDTGNIDSANQNMKKLNNTVSNSNTIFGRLKNTIGNTFSTGKLAMTGYLAVLNEINKAGKNAKQTINELDKAATDLAVATNMSRESVSELVKNYNDYAKELKSTTTQITSAADDYLRAGKSMSETQALIKDSIMLSKLGQLEAGTATEDLLAVMNGYEMSIEEVRKSLDAMVALDMAAATSSGDIATALKYCASSADVAGVSFNKLAAMVAVVQDKTQQSAETIGTFMNTLLSRYRDVKIGQFVSGDGEDISQVETILNSLDIKLRDSSQEFRDFETVIEEVALSWEDYSSVQQAAIAKAFSGTRQQNRFLALMEGYNKTLELTEVAANSAGTAIEKFENSYMNSLEAKQNALQASFESMIMNSDFSEIYAGILETTTALVDFMNQTNALKGVLTGLTVTGGIKGFLAIKTGVNEAYIALNKFQNALNIVKQTNISTQEYERLLLLSNGLSTSQMKLVLSTNSLSVAQKKELLMASGLSEEEAILQLQTWKMTAANTGLTASTVTLGNAFKALWSTLIANPLVIVTALISGAVMAYQSYNQKLEETRQANLDAATTASESADKLKDLYNEYKRLASIQDRTTSEEESFKTAVENITVALGDKAEIIKDLTAGTDEYADALARATKEELQSQAVTATIGRKSAEETLQGNIWSDWSGSKVSVDSNSKGKSLSDEAQKAVDIVSDSLKEFETINRTWKSISWDISSDNPTEALEFYNSLIEAREKLVLASKDDETLLDTEIYEDLNTAVNTMSESLDTYIEKLYEEEKLNYMAQNGIPSVTEEYKAMESALVSAAGSSVDLQDKFKELLMSDFSDLATDIGNVGNAVENVSAQAGKAIPLFNQLTTSEEALDQFQASIKSATDAYATLLSGNYTSTELLDCIQAINKAMSNMGGTLDWEFINRQTDSLELLGNAIQHISQKCAESILSGAGIDIDSEFGQMLANIIGQIYDTEAAFEGMNSQLDNLQSSYQTLTGILEAYNETGYINLDNLQSLLTADENFIQMLQVENGQLTLNQAAYENLVAVQLLEFKAKLNDAAAAEIEALAKQKAEQATNQNADASQNAVAKLDAETQAFNRNTSAAIANAVAKAEENGVSEAEIQGVFDKYTEVWNSAMNNYSVDFDSFMSGGKSAASKSGSEHADAYLKAFEEEYSRLKDMLDRGEISEAQYLNALRRLYTRYFKDRKEYLDEYRKYESEYLSGMLALHNKALSGISTLLNRKISAANDAKDAAISALQEEKEAAAEAYQNQIDNIEKEKDAIDDLIKEKNKKIDSINEEIEAIERAAESRRKNIQLEKDQFALEKMLNQRTSLVYKGGQFVYEADTSGVRDAREKVREDQEALQIDSLKNEISLIQKEIDLLEEKKDALSEEQDRIQKLMDESNKYYDNLIKQQEKMWDSMIKGLEQQKSKWEELADIQEIAEAFSAIEQVFGEMGYTVEDILNGNEQAFEDFKSKYISLLSDMNNNSSFADGLTYATGIAKENLGSFLDKTQEAGAGIDELSTKAGELGTITEGMDGLAASASEANTNISETATNVGEVAANVGNLETNLHNVNALVSEEQTAFDNLKQTIDEVLEAIDQKTEAIQNEQNAVGIATSSEMADFLLLKDKILEVKETLDTVNDTVATMDRQPIDNLTTAFQMLYNQLLLVSNILSVNAENSIASSIQALNEISLEDGIIAQFTNLKEAIDSVTAAISGGGGDSEGGEGQGGNSASGQGGSSGGKGSESGGGGSSLTGAITEMGSTAQEVIGEPDAEGDGTVIGEFGSMETAVTDVTAAIGGGESGSGEGSGSGESGGEDENNLIGSIVNLGETTEEVLGEPGGDGVIGRFEQFKVPIQEADTHVHSISDGLDAIDGKEVECTITVNIKTNGSIPAFASGTALSGMNLNSAEYNAKYTGNAHVEGTALASGNWAVQSNEQNALVGEEGFEIIVRNGKFFTVGENGAEMTNIKRNDIVFNHEQSVQLLKYGRISGRGKAYADGTVGNGKFLTPSGKIFQEYNPDKDDSSFGKLYKAWHAHYDNLEKDVHEINEELSHHLLMERNEQMQRDIAQISNASSIVNNTRNVQPVVTQQFNITMPNITDSTSAATLMNDLQSLATKKFQVNW
ncbi:MAG: phage tail tape measure protein [Clostridium sp.]|nr:phage tail tape measure protein [Clostridium sp.]